MLSSVVFGTVELLMQNALNITPVLNLAELGQATHDHDPATIYLHRTHSLLWGTGYTFCCYNKIHRER